MESANSHHHHHNHHQLQDQIVGSSSSSPPSSSSCFELGTTPPAWSTPPFSSLLNNNNNNFISSYPQYSSPMPPDLSFYNWSNNEHTFVQGNNNNLQNPRNNNIKEEDHLSSEHYYRNYVDILSSTASPNNNSSRNNNNTAIDEQPNDYLGTKLLLKSFSSGNLMTKNQISPPDFYNSNYNNNSGGASINGRGLFCSSQIFPSVNVSSLSSSNQNFTNPTSLDMNLEALDLLTSSRFSGEFGGASSHNQNQNGGFAYGFDHHHMQQQVHQTTTPFYSTSKVSSGSSNGAVETKRSSSRIEPKAPNAPKKSRLEARASCPPFKVRKEKLGDRIAALQQLVAPFGKTDTASVLMEAIGYIKFLQSQVETLSVPYMKSSRNKSSRVMKVGVSMENENEEQRRDLKSRGLCLVPLSCLSYMTDGDGGAAVWPPPHFGGGAT
ncbi:hypothetical protein ABFS83_03G069000 [Erythranthe nasuta]